MILAHAALWLVASVSCASTTTGKIVVAYVVDGSGIQASQIDYSIVTNVHYSFGSLDMSGNVVVPVGLSSSFVNEVHAN
ncbi:hypothetical protein HDU98_012164, partial [Podochytrium sp. JEL0797]